MVQLMENVMTEDKENQPKSNDDNTLAADAPETPKTPSNRFKNCLKKKLMKLLETQ